MSSPPNYNIPTNRPRHSFANVDMLTNNGFIIPREAYFVVSGTLSNVVSHTTGSISFHIDAYAAKLKGLKHFILVPLQLLTLV